MKKYRNFKKSTNYTLLFMGMGIVFYLFPHSIDYIKIIIDSMTENKIGLTIIFNMLGSVFFGAAVCCIISPRIHGIISSLVHQRFVIFFIYALIYAAIYLVISWIMGLYIDNEIVVTLFLTFCSCLLTECIGVMREEENNSNKQNDQDLKAS